MAVTDLPPPPVKQDPKFDNWMFRLWKRARNAVEYTIIGATAPILATTGTGTIGISHSTSGAIPGTYGAAGSVPVLVVDTYGHVTSGTTTAIAIAGTNVTGTDLVVSAPLTGTATNALLRSGTIGHGTSGAIPGTYGNGGNVSQVIVDTYGHVTSGTTVAISTAPGNFTVGGLLTAGLTDIRVASGVAAYIHKIGGDLMRLTGAGTSVGAYIDVTNPAETDYEPFTIFAESFQIQARNGTGSTVPIFFVSTNGVLFNTDNTYDIGASGANRPRNLYLGGTLVGAVAGTSVVGADVTATTPILVGGTNTNAALRPFTISHATSGVTPSTYGAVNSTPVVTVNTYGHVTAASSVSWGTITGTFSSLQIGTRAIISLPSNSTERGPWNFFASAVRGMGRRLWGDEDFTSGVNQVSVYNNAGNGAVTITRGTHTSFEASVLPPNSSGMSLKISYLNPPGAAIPGFGGFVQDINPEENHTFVQMFQAKLPSGRSLELAENDQGTNRTSYWLTDVAGTGKWEWYIRVSHCGDSGSFVIGGHVYVIGGSDASFDWYLASSSVWDVTECLDILTAQTVTAAVPITFVTGTTGAGTSTIAHSTSGVASGTYGNSGTLGQFVVDTYGHVTSVSNVGISISGTAYTGTGTVSVDAPIRISAGIGDAAALKSFTIAHTTSGVVSGTYGGTAGNARIVIDTYGHITSGTTVPDRIVQNIQNGNYTLVLTDANGHIYREGTATGVATWTIPAGTSVAYDIGTPISFVNDGTGNVTLAIASDTLAFAGTGATGSRTLPQYGMASILKVTSARWLISGAGVY